jgi:pimeloyl-ACP methyl ester carboxylesterase
MEKAISADGTPIAFQRAGAGPNLLLVHGTAASHARWNGIRPRLEEHFTTIAVDRRGRGESGDGDEYAIEREFEDIAAVANALDAPVLLFGHSYGAICALEAAARTDKVAALILYEPPIVAEGERVYSTEQLAALERLLAAGDRDGVVATFFRDIVGMPAHELDLVRASPAWPARVAAAHTLPRELRAQEAYRMDTPRVGRLAMPVLLLLGGESPVFFGKAIERLAAALPNARKVVMPGQKHIAMDTAPDLVISAVLDFRGEARQ